jgi:hypothetical protein
MNSNQGTAKSNTESKEDTNMTAAKSTAKKSTARKPAAKKTTARKGTKRTRKPAAKLTPEVREVLAKTTATAIEAALASEDIPVKRSAAGDLAGNRQGMKARIVLDDGSVITVTAVYR